MRNVHCCYFNRLRSGVRISFLFKWAIPGLFFIYFRLFYVEIQTTGIKSFAKDGIRSADLWCWKRPLFQPLHNHGPRLSFVSFVIWFFSNLTWACWPGAATSWPTGESLNDSQVWYDWMQVLYEELVFSVSFCILLDLFWMPITHQCLNKLMYEWPMLTNNNLDTFVASRFRNDVIIDLNKQTENI